MVRIVRIGQRNRLNSTERKVRLIVMIDSSH